MGLCTDSRLFIYALISMRTRNSLTFWTMGIVITNLCEWMNGRPMGRKQTPQITSFILFQRPDTHGKMYFMHIFFSRVKWCMVALCRTEILPRFSNYMAEKWKYMWVADWPKHRVELLWLDNVIVTVSFGWLSEGGIETDLWLLKLFWA